MIKILSVIVLITSSLFAQNFNDFLNDALKNSPYLKSTHLGINQAKEEGDALLLYDNPTLGLRYSRFKPEDTASSNGYALEYTQALRLPGVGSDKEKLSSSLSTQAKAAYSLTKAELIKEISLAYTNYVEKKLLEALSEEEIVLAKVIYDISQQKYDDGMISRGLLYEAGLDLESLEIAKEALKYETLESYFTLLELAGKSSEIEISLKHDFALDADKNTNAHIHFIQTQKAKALASADVESHAIESLELYAAYDNEPTEDVISLGLNIPLAIFNTKSQERTIARLEADKMNLLIEKENSKITLEKLKLDKQRVLLQSLKSRSQNHITKLEEVLGMFEESYKIAKVNLLELQDIKSKLIKTKSALISIQTKLNQNIIMSNYLAGSL